MRRPVDAAFPALGERQAVGAQRRYRPLGLGRFRDEEVRSAGVLPRASCAACRSSGNVAAVGLSKPRNQRFEGLQLDEELRKRDADPWCGVQIVSLTNGDVVNWIRFEGDITEIFDISFLPNVRNPMMIGLRTPEIRDLITFESELTSEATA